MTSNLYAAAISVTSGTYSVGSALGWWGSMGSSGSVMAGMGPMDTAAWVMLAIGVVVIVHGVVLLTPAARRLGRGSGALMLVWAAVMLGNQALAAMDPGGGMMMPGGRGRVDAGMVALAALMLASGLIMLARPMSSPMDR